MNSHDRRKEAVPAYWVSDFGVFREVPLPNHRPLYWHSDDALNYVLSLIKEKDEGLWNYLMKKLENSGVITTQVTQQSSENVSDESIKKATKEEALTRHVDLSL